MNFVSIKIHESLSSFYVVAILLLYIFFQFWVAKKIRFIGDGQVTVVWSTKCGSRYCLSLSSSFNKHSSLSGC